jgi:SSS family solute:Na+ symporter
MVGKFYSIKDEGSIKKGTLISTVFAVVVAGGCYFLGGFGRLYYDDMVAGGYISDTGAVLFDKVVPTMLTDLAPVVVALIGVPMIDMLKATKMRWWSWVVWIASMTLVCILSVSPIYILICVIVVAAFISWYNNRPTTGTHNS